jgi:hypothetical protein
MYIRELVGFAGGVLLAPLVAAGSLLRRGRIFHPDGVVYRAEVVPDAMSEAGQEVAARLAGPALVRLSSALWKVHKERRPDLLGASVRFRGEQKISPVAMSGDQDLLTATARSALLLLPAMFATNVHSFLWDDYYAIGQFDIPELGRVKLRLLTPRIGDGSLSRLESLEKAVAAGMAILELEAREARIGARYERIARIRLLERVDIDQSALRFSPFRAGRGIRPRGFINALRIVPYAVSQLVRPQHE